MAKKKTKKDYEEWKGYTLHTYSKTQFIVGSIWNEIMANAERDGVADYLLEDEEDMINTLEIIVHDAQ